MGPSCQNFIKAEKTKIETNYFENKGGNGVEFARAELGFEPAGVKIRTEYSDPVLVIQRCWF